MAAENDRLEIIVDAMAPEELPRDGDVAVFVHDSGRTVTLTGTRRDLRFYLSAHWGVDSDDDWIAETLDGGTVVEAVVEPKGVACSACGREDDGSEGSRIEGELCDDCDALGPPRTILLHLNVEVRGATPDELPVDEIETAIKGAIEVGLEGAPLLENHPGASVTFTIPLAEEV